MKKINFALLALLLLIQVGFVRSQDDSEVVKINTAVIQVDATVTDKNGKIVTDLKPEDFEIYENGTKRQITGFSFVDSSGKTADVSSNLLLTGANSNLTAAPPQTIGQVRRIVAVVIDDLLLSKTGVEYAKREITRFVGQQVEAGDLVAVIKTSGSVGVLQKFTSDKAQLLKSIEEIKFHPLTSIGTSRFAPIGISFSDQVIGNITTGGAVSGSSSVTSNRSDIEASSNTFRNQLNALGGLQVLRNTIDAMGYLKGKKTLLFVSEGSNLVFSLENKNALNSVSDNGITISNANSLNIADRHFEINNFLQAITESANRNSVSIFPIDPSGAAATNLAADDATGGFFPGKSNAQIDSEIVGRNDSIRGAQETLKYLARETGGKAFINKNDYGKEIKDVFDAQKGYYLLAYEPDEETFNTKDNRFNKLEIKVKRPNLNVSYRSGFFNVSTASKQNPAAAGDAILQKLFVPYNFSDIGVEATSIYAGTEKNNATIRSFVNILPNNLTVSDITSEKKSVKFDLVAAVFNEDGITVGSLARNYEVSFDAKSYDNFLKSGVISNLTFNIQNPGTYRVKVLVKDSKSNKIGTTTQTIFVPDTEKQPISFSGFLLQNYTAAQWQDLQKNPSGAGNAQKMQIDTAFRHFKKGTVLSFTYALNLSPELAKNGNAKLTLTTKLLKDNQTIFTFAPEIIPIAGQAAQKVNRRSAFNIGTEMQKGKYTLQTVADTDKTHDTEMQSIDFEVVE